MPKAHGKATGTMPRNARSDARSRTCSSAVANWRAGARAPLVGGLQAARSKGYIAAKAVGTWVPGLTRKAFEKYGFSTATLITDWAAIVGPELARCTEPERLKWPRGVETYGEISAEAEGRPGATLILRVDPAFALDIDYKRTQIIERVNVFFGYKALADMRIIQSPLVGSKPPLVSAKAPVAALAPSADLASVTDEGLRNALIRLQKGVQSRTSKAD